MAARSMKMAFSIAVMVAIAVIGTSDAATYTVGDATGWNQPTNANDEVYDNWALGKSFYVGDVLVFNFATGVHDVAQVNLQAADDCVGTNPISIATTGPASITLTTVGMNYFICTKAGHCDAGQELKINVLAGNGTTGSPPGTTTPSPSGSVTPPPPPPSTSSAASVAAGGLAALIAAAAFLY